MSQAIPAMSAMPPASIDLIFKHPREILRFADLVERLRLTDEETRFLAAIRPDQWSALIQRCYQQPAVRRAGEVAWVTRDARAAVAEVDVEPTVRRELELLGIVIIGLGAGLVASIIGFIAVTIGLIVAIQGTALLAVIGALIGLIGAFLTGVIALATGIMALVLYFMPDNDPRAQAIGTTIFGGTGGDPFIDEVALARRVVSVRIRHGNIVHAIQTTWQMNDGTIREGARHGHELGEGNDVCTLAEGEYFTKITGRSGPVIHQISLHTSRGRSFGPFGGNGGEDFTLDPDFGEQILGFHGRAGENLDALGVCSPVYGSGMKGGPDGLPFLDVPPPGGRLKRVIVTYERVVESIQVEWIDARGTVRVGARHGGGNGRRKVVDLADDEWIARVSGRAGAVLDRLELHTSRGETHEFGDIGGEPFTIDLEPGEQIVGFFGRAESRVDALGVCVARADHPSLQNGARIALQSNHRPFLGVVGEELVAHRPSVGELEVFTITAEAKPAGEALRFGDVVSLRAPNGLFVSARPGYVLRADRPIVGDSERFTLTHPVSASSRAPLAPGEILALRAHQGGYLLTLPQRAVIVDREAPGADGTWLLHLAPPPRG